MVDTTKLQAGRAPFTVVTGAAGFIGSRLACKLREKRGDEPPLLLVDDTEFFSTRPCCDPFREMKGLKFVTPSDFQSQFEKNEIQVKEIFHMGACSRTDEMRVHYLNENNTRYTERLWESCRARGIPFYYASSAATYGNGDQGYVDDPALIPKLQPMNPYGWSKQNFDLYVLKQLEAGLQPPHWAGFKFFNVYGPGEEHKGSQATAMQHAFDQFSRNGVMKLFRSHKEGIADGCQMRDFVHIDDVCSVMMDFSDKKLSPGIYNVGTGEARTFIDLTRAAAAAMGIECNVEWIDTPERLREHYQYYTQADLGRLRKAGYDKPFMPLEEGTHASWTEWKARHA